MKNKKLLLSACCFIVGFVLWTVLLCIADVQSVGVNDTKVGMASINLRFCKLVGVNMTLYSITDWLGLVPVCVAAAFGLVGASQWLHRKKLGRVDRSILLMGVFYTVVAAVYLFFETAVINYRPVLINGIMEASYPSSTTMLSMCIMPTAYMELERRIKKTRVKKLTAVAITAFTGFMVIGRLISGVHWLTDIIGGILLSTGLVLLYGFALSVQSTSLRH